MATKLAYTCTSWTRSAIAFLHNANRF